MSAVKIKASGGRRAGLLLCACVLVAAFAFALAAPDGARTAAQAQSTVTFAMIGDFGSNDSNEQDVANLVKSWNPDFIVTVGDNNYPDGEAATIDANVGKYYHEFIHPYTGSFGAGASTNRFWPVIGNRDWENQSGPKLQPYFDYFTLPNNERYYDFAQGPVHFFMLDSDSREPDGITDTSVQAQWLRNRLAVSTAPWKIVVLHHPPFSSRTSWPKLQWPFRQWGADAVVSGHAHIYERIIRDGLPYLVDGLGGESLGSFSTAIEGSMVRFGGDFGALRVTAGSASITFEFITRRGVLVDTYTINRNATTPAPPTNLSAAAVSTSQIDLNWADNSSNEDGFKVERSADGVSFTGIATVGPGVNAYTNTGLSPSTTYYYRVLAFVGEVNSAYSNTATATTTMNAPAAPTNLSAAASSSGQINLSWADASTNEESFEIERCQGAGCTSFAWIAEVGAGATTYGNTGLAPSTTYRYRVRASNGSGDSAYSNVAEATTLPTSAGLPAAPSNLSGTPVSTQQVNLVWADNAGNETGFKLYRSTDAVNFSRIATLGPNTTSYSDTGRAAATTYHYRVLAYNDEGNSPNSNTVGVTTFPPANVKPNPPSNLVATALSSTQIRLAWSDNSNNEDEFRLYRSTDGVNFTQINKPGPNVTVYTDAGLAARTTYYYRVRASNDAGNSAYSNTSSARTP